MGTEDRFPWGYDWDMKKPVGRRWSIRECHVGIERIPSSLGLSGTESGGSEILHIFSRRITTVSGLWPKIPKIFGPFIVKARFHCQFGDRNKCPLGSSRNFCLLTHNASLSFHNAGLAEIDTDLRKSNANECGRQKDDHPLARTDARVRGVPLAAGWFSDDWCQVADNRHCEERTGEAISIRPSRLLRPARNDRFAVSSAARPMSESR